MTTITEAAPQDHGTTFAWLTTSPNPHHPGTGVDAGQRGWRLHAVLIKEGEAFEDYKRRSAMCGIRARHGWGLDMFIEDECARCQAAMTRREASGELFTDLADIAKAKREDAARMRAAECADRKANDSEEEEDDFDV